MSKAWRPIRVLLCAFLATSMPLLSARAADDYPTGGMLHHTTENSALTFTCARVQKDLIDCDFDQTFVRKKATPEELAKQLEEAEKRLTQGLETETVKAMQSDGTCKEMAVLAPVVRGEQTPDQVLSNLPNGYVSNEREFIDGMNRMTEVQKRDFLEGAEVFDRFCATGTPESFLDIIRHDQKKTARTCRVGSNSFKQRFRWVSDYRSGGSWVVVGDGPEGPCGVINLSRFEPVQTRHSKVIFWRYYAKKAVTNPKGSLLLGHEL